MSLYQFDPEKHNVICGGSLITGFADGTYINIEATSDTYTMTNGINTTIRVKQNDDSATVILTLQYASPGNTILGNFRKLDKSSGFGTFSFLAKDILNPLNEHIAGTCWIRRPPSFSGSKDAPNYEWTIDTNSLVFSPNGGVLLV